MYRTCGTGLAAPARRRRSRTGRVSTNSPNRGSHQRADLRENLSSSRSIVRGMDHCTPMIGLDHESVKDFVENAGTPPPRLPSALGPTAATLTTEPAVDRYSSTQTRHEQIQGRRDVRTRDRR